MKCPNCNETLLMTERHHVEIDYCPSCRGVWLDKGELDKLLQFASQQSDRPGNYNQNNHSERSGHYDDRSSDYREKSKYPQQQYRKKKSFLSDFFDFD